MAYHTSEIAKPQAAEYSATCAMNAEPPPGVGSIELRKLLPTHRLFETLCTTWDLGDRPVTDCSAEDIHVHLEEEVAKR